MSIKKISLSSFNNFIDKKVYVNKPNAITPNKQQLPPKINKPNFQRMNRGRPPFRPNTNNDKDNKKLR